MEICLKVKKIVGREGKGKGCLAIFNVFFEGKTIDGKEPFIKGIRLFQSDEKECRKYIRLTQIPMKNKRYMNVISLPEEQFRELQTRIIKKYEIDLSLI